MVILSTRFCSDELGFCMDMGESEIGNILVYLNYTASRHNLNSYRYRTITMNADLLARLYEYAKIFVLFGEPEIKFATVPSITRKIVHGTGVAQAFQHWNQNERKKGKAEVRHWQSIMDNMLHFLDILLQITR